jgi:hypothetical protein
MSGFGIATSLKGGCYMEETMVMTKKEVERIKILSQFIEGKISQVLAAKKLGISDRQTLIVSNKNER